MRWGRVDAAGTTAPGFPGEVDLMIKVWQAGSRNNETNEKA